MIGEDIAFGDPKNGVALLLKNGLQSATFFHAIDSSDDPIYTPLHGRGARKVDLELDGIEICCQNSSVVPESDKHSSDADLDELDEDTSSGEAELAWSDHGSNHG